MQAISGISSTQPASGKQAGDTNVGTDTFLTLLIAQLKSQNPLDPMNPNEFVAQLAQFNSLSQLIEIKQLLQQATLTAPGNSGSTGADGGPTGTSVPGGIG
jgi:flagellar basal-body rod modification protein FlgD